MDHYFFKKKKDDTHELNKWHEIIGHRNGMKDLFKV